MSSNNGRIDLTRPLDSGRVLYMPIPFMPRAFYWLTTGGRGAFLCCLSERFCAGVFDIGKASRTSINDEMMRTRSRKGTAVRKSQMHAAIAVHIVILCYTFEKINLKPSEQHFGFADSSICRFTHEDSQVPFYYAYGLGRRPIVSYVEDLETWTLRFEYVLENENANHPLRT